MLIQKEIYNFCKELFPIHRSITGNGVRKTLHLIREHLPELKIIEVPSGTPCFDWTIPNEWNINDAFVIDPDGRKIVNFRENNLHVVGYSIPVDKVVHLAELKEHLFSLPELPNALPYITSYYKPFWGFCVQDSIKKKLKDGNYKVKIDSVLKPGNLSYGELIIPGKSKKEVFLSTYICHPSMANNEVSGPAVTTFLAKWLLEQKNHYYTYRVIFIPETIGSIVYLSKHYKQLVKNVVAGYNITCVGDDNSYSFLPSRNENTLADLIALHVLKYSVSSFLKYSFLERGSDERQYCSPGIDLPVVSIPEFDPNFTHYATFKSFLLMAPRIFS